MANTKSALADNLLSKLKNNQATIGVVGLGYVGLPLSIRFSQTGYKTIGFDIDAGKVQQLTNGESYINHIESQQIVEMVENGFHATTDFSRIHDVDAIILCVPTPLTQTREPDISFIISTAEAICPYLRSGQVVSLESTTYPGTTEEELLPRIQEKGFIVGEDIFLVYSPEREDPGRVDHNTQTIPKVCGGVTSSCLEVGIALYANAIDTIVPVSSTRTAELTKLLENIYRAVNIGMVNEMKIVADSMGIDIHEAIAAASSKPFGFTPFYPGPGLGGHCLPIDPFYLSWKARQYGVDSRFIELAGEVNTSMPQWIVDKTKVALSNKGKSIEQAKILILGIAYKKNIDDMRESPAAAIMDILQQANAELYYCDPYVPVFPKMRNHYFDLQSKTLCKEILANSDAVIITTDHDIFDYELIAEHAPLVIDTRGRYPHPANDNIVSA